MYDEVIKLVKVTSTLNAYGDHTETRTNRTVFAELKSIGQNEFYQAQANGLKPECKFVLPDYLEYQGEETVLYKPFGSTTEDEYGVIRTFRSGNTLELICKRGAE